MGKAASRATSIAAARELPGVLLLDAHAQLAVLPTETTRKTSPADFTGDFTAGGRFFTLGVTATFAFAEAP